MKNTTYIFTMVIFFLSAVFSLASTTLESALQKDIADSQLDEFTHIEAAFILSGVNDSDSLRHYINWYNTLIQTLKD